MGTARSWPAMAVASALLVLGISLSAPASEVTTLETFTPGTIADANAVNANFSALQAGVNDNHARIATLESKGTVRRMTIQGISLAHPDTFSVITVNSAGDGLDWQQDAIESASLQMRRPIDYTGGDVTFTLVFRKISGTGSVEFVARANSFDPGEAFADTGANAGVPVDVGAGSFNSFYSVQITIPGAKLGKSLWHVRFQRGGSGDTHAGDVLLNFVDLEYPVG